MPTKATRLCQVNSHVEGNWYPLVHLPGRLATVHFSQVKMLSPSCHLLFLFLLQLLLFCLLTLIYCHHLQWQVAEAGACSWNAGVELGPVFLKCRWWKESPCGAWILKCMFSGLIHQHSDYGSTWSSFGWRLWEKFLHWPAVTKHLYIPCYPHLWQQVGGEKKKIQLCQISVFAPNIACSARAAGQAEGTTKQYVLGQSPLRSSSSACPVSTLVVGGCEWETQLNCFPLV